MMPEPDEAQFTCIGCGESVPVGSDLCPGCRHPFREPIPAASPEEWLWIPEDPPEPRARKIPAIRIGTAMILVAVIAVCLGAFTIGPDPTLGVLVTLGLLPASLRVSYLSAIRAAEGRPMSRDDKILSYFATAGSTILIAASSMVAFGMTCMGIVGGRQDDSLGYWGGGAAAVVVGVILIRILLKWSGDEDRRARDWERLRKRRSGR
ncbi:hypothetical protein P12x_005083 [Tundrisphaera lichenicola]|uniref:hypothetical protein n=1 Tax=Tundrisphaera lichenicola TaxID=2029860 RepID=UPI003EC0FF03